MNTRFLAALLALAVPEANATAADGTPPAKVEIIAKRDAEWGSYRRAYGAASMFEKHTRSRPLIQAHMQILPRRHGLSLDGLRLQLAGETTNVDIAVDAIGRATVPMLKSAYDEDAVLRLNRQQGHYRFSGRFSIKENESGVYSAVTLRAACEQMLAAQRDAGNRFRLIGKQCVGVKFIFPQATSGPVLAFAEVAGTSTTIPATDGLPFEGIPLDAHKIALYRFAAWPSQGDVVAAQRLLFIAPLYE